MQEGLPGSLPPQHSARDSHHSEVSSSTLLASDTCRCETSPHSRGQAGDRSGRKHEAEPELPLSLVLPLSRFGPGEPSAFLCPRDCQHLARNFLVPITLEGPMIRWGQAEVRERDFPRTPVPACTSQVPRKHYHVLRFSRWLVLPPGPHTYPARPGLDLERASPGARQRRPQLKGPGPAALGLSVLFLGGRGG